MAIFTLTLHYIFFCSSSVFVSVQWLPGSSSRNAKFYPFINHQSNQYREPVLSPVAHTHTHTGHIGILWNDVISSGWFSLLSLLPNEIVHHCTHGLWPTIFSMPDILHFREEYLRNNYYSLVLLLFRNFPVLSVLLLFGHSAALHFSLQHIWW